MNFWDLLGVLAPVFCIVGSGALARHLRWIQPEADSSLLRLAINLLFTALIADSILGNPLLNSVGDFWLPPVLGFALVSLSMGVVAFVLGRMQLPAETQRAGTVTAGIQNYGYLVIPIVSALYDPATLGVLFLHNLGVELAMWGLGVWVLTRGTQTSLRGLLTTPPTLAIVACAALNVLHADTLVPVFLKKTLHLLGQNAIPMALILVGVTLYDGFRQKNEVSTRWGALGATMLCRLLVLPCVFLIVARWLPMPQALQRILLIQAAMPAAMMPVVLCRMHNADSRFAAQIALGSTALGLLSIPLWMRLGFAWVAPNAAG
jgi:predicted permease